MENNQWMRGVLFVCATYTDTLDHCEHDVWFARWHDYVIRNELAQNEENQCGHHQDGGNAERQWIAIITVETFVVLAQNRRHICRD